MQGHDIIVIGASVGGVEALSNLVAQFPEDLPATIFVVQHVIPTATGHLAQSLNRAGPLPATMAQDCESFEPGISMWRHQIITCSSSRAAYV
jgi:two-component system, chemotaxis family, protein-glutamate methylesterase/glutaminase